MRTAFLRRFRDRCADTTDLWCAYAMTEMLPVSVVESREKLASGEDGDLVGTPIAGVHARVADDGELFLRGPNLFRGYLGHDPVVEHATGDLARIARQEERLVLPRLDETVAWEIGCRIRAAAMASAPELQGETSNPSAARVWAIIRRIDGESSTITIW